MLFIFLQINPLFAQNDDELYMDAYIVIADTSNSYEDLKIKMIQLSKYSRIEIDTMGREYNKIKNLIALPENSSDEIYAGDYFPRRFPSEKLSIEYFSFYSAKDTYELMALVTLITDDKEKAQNQLKKIKNHINTAFTINTKIYMGCMH